MHTSNTQLSRTPTTFLNIFFVCFFRAPFETVLHVGNCISKTTLNSSQSLISISIRTSSTSIKQNSITGTRWSVEPKTNQQGNSFPPAPLTPPHHADRTSEAKRSLLHWRRNACNVLMCRWCRQAHPSFVIIWFFFLVVASNDTSPVGDQSFLLMDSSFPFIYDLNNL
jgi:hypothetical protein